MQESAALINSDCYSSLTISEPLGAPMIRFRPADLPRRLQARFFSCCTAPNGSTRVGV
jgi:hypothetical protein